MNMYYQNEIKNGLNLLIAYMSSFSIFPGRSLLEKTMKFRYTILYGVEVKILHSFMSHLLFPGL